jgi:hypothetical protein
MLPRQSGTFAKIAHRAISLRSVLFANFAYSEYSGLRPLRLMDFHFFYNPQM